VATTNDLKNGLVLNIDGQLWTVVEFQHVKPGKGPAFVRTKLKAVLSGKVVDRTFNAGTKVDTATVDKRDMQYLYKDGTDFVFMDMNTYDQLHVPGDTVGTARLPVGVRLELVGDADAVDVTYTTRTDDFGYRGPGAGATFALMRAGKLVDEQAATLGDGTVRLTLGGDAPDARAVVYLPEGMQPVVRAVAGVGGAIEPAPAQPRRYGAGDSDGCVTSRPWGTGTWLPHHRRR